MKHECSCCSYSTCRVTDWHRHMRTAKHRRLASGQSVEPLHVCYVCMYGTSRYFNLKIHLRSHRHLQRYLHILQGSSKPAEQWEKGLISRRSDCLTLEQIRLTPISHRLSPRKEVRLFINGLLSIAVTSRPIIPIDNTFWLLYTNKGWKRAIPLSVLNVLRWCIAFRIAGGIEHMSLMPIIAYLYKPKSASTNSYICRAIHSALEEDEGNSEPNMVELGLAVSNGALS